jgi:hypothetical protein
MVDEIEEINRCEISNVVSLVFCVKSISESWFLRIIQVTMKHDPILCHVGIHVGFTSTLHSLAPWIPQAWCEANLDRVHFFSTNESA